MNKPSPGLLAWAFVSTLESGRKRPDQRLALADNADRNANAHQGERRFHGSLYRFHLCVRQASTPATLNVLESAKQNSIKVYELATDLSQSVPMCPARQTRPAPKRAKAKQMPRKLQLPESSDLLSCHYRAIGPAAIMAALLCCRRVASKSGAKSA